MCNVKLGSCTVCFWPKEQFSVLLVRPRFSFPLLGELSPWTTPAILEWQTKMAEAVLPVLKRKLAPYWKRWKKRREKKSKKEVGEQPFDSFRGGGKKIQKETPQSSK